MQPTIRMSEIIEIKQILDFLQQGAKADKFYWDKIPAKMRQLEFYIQKLDCVELRNIVRRKARSYVTNVRPTFG